MQRKNKEPTLNFVKDRNAFHNVKLPIGALTRVASDAMDAASIVNKRGMELKISSLKVVLGRQEGTF